MAGDSDTDWGLFASDLNRGVADLSAGIVGTIFPGTGPLISSAGAAVSSAIERGTGHTPTPPATKVPPPTPAKTPGCVNCTKEGEGALWSNLLKGDGGAEGLGGLMQALGGGAGSGGFDLGAILKAVGGVEGATKLLGSGGVEKIMGVLGKGGDLQGLLGKKPPPPPPPAPPPPAVPPPASDGAGTLVVVGLVGLVGLGTVAALVAASRSGKAVRNTRRLVRRTGGGT